MRTVIVEFVSNMKQIKMEPLIKGKRLFHYLFSRSFIVQRR